MQVTNWGSFKVTSII